jgi:hypothetical protein
VCTLHGGLEEVAVATPGPRLKIKDVLRGAPAHLPADLVVVKLAAALLVQQLLPTTLALGLEATEATLRMEAPDACLYKSVPHT